MFPQNLYLYNSQDSVYFWSEQLQQFALYIDFGAKAGESWEVGGLFGNPPGQNLIVRVDSITTVNYGGTLLQLRHVTYNDNFSGIYWQGKIADRFGNLFSFSPENGVCDALPIKLRCYEDATINYHFVTFPCDLTITLTNATDQPAGRARHPAA